MRQPLPQSTVLVMFATGITPAAPTVTVLLAAGKKDWFDLASASD